MPGVHWSKEVQIDYSKEQVDWLKARLKEHHGPSFVFMHAPPFSAGFHRMDWEMDSVMQDRRDQIVRAMHEGGISVIAGGHEHDYERALMTWPDKTVLISMVQGGAGAPLHPLPPPEQAAAIIASSKAAGGTIKAENVYTAVINNFTLLRLWFGGGELQTYAVDKHGSAKLADLVKIDLTRYGKPKINQLKVPIQPTAQVQESKMEASHKAGIEAKGDTVTASKRIENAPAPGKKKPLRKTSKDHEAHEHNQAEAQREPRAGHALAYRRLAGSPSLLLSGRAQHRVRLLLDSVSSHDESHRSWTDPAERIAGHQREHGTSGGTKKIDTARSHHEGGIDHVRKTPSVIAIRIESPFSTRRSFRKCVSRCAAKARVVGLPWEGGQGHVADTEAKIFRCDPFDHGRAQSEPRNVHVADPARERVPTGNPWRNPSRHHAFPVFRTRWSSRYSRFRSRLAWFPTFPCCRSSRYSPFLLPSHLRSGPAPAKPASPEGPVMRVCVSCACSFGSSCPVPSH
jgi:hypothetical protein